MDIVLPTPSGPHIGIRLLVPISSSKKVKNSFLSLVYLNIGFEFEITLLSKYTLKTGDKTDKLTLSFSNFIKDLAEFISFSSI